MEPMRKNIGKKAADKFPCDKNSVSGNEIPAKIN